MKMCLTHDHSIGGWQDDYNPMPMCPNINNYCGYYNTAHYLRDYGTIGILSKRASFRCDRSQLISYIVRHSLCRELLGLRGLFPDVNRVMPISAPLSAMTGTAYHCLLEHRGTVCRISVTI